MKFWEFEGCRLEAGMDGCLWHGDSLIHLQPKGLEILKVLVDAHDRVVSRDELMERVWPATYVESGNLNFTVSSLRKTLREEVADGVEFISTVPKIGYKFAPAVTPVFQEIVPEAQSGGSLRHLITTRWRLLLLFLISILFLSSFSAWSVIETGFDNVPSKAGDREGGKAASAVPGGKTITRGTTNDEAYRLYLRAKTLMKLRKSTDENALDLFRKAVDLDPNFAAAWVGIADSLAFLEPPQSGLSDAINKALEIDPFLADAWATRGFVRMFHHWDWREAEKSLDKAVELEPYNAKAWHWLGVLYSLKGDFDEARKAMRRAQDLNPDSNFIRHDLAELFYFERDYASAARAAGDLLKLDPGNQKALLLLARIRMMQGDRKGAGEQFLRAIADRPYAGEARSRYDEGGFEDLVRFYVRANGCDRFGEIPSMECPVFLEVTGEEDEALSYLETAVQRRVFLLPFIKIDPFWDRLRDDPRFREVVAKMNLG